MPPYKNILIFGANGQIGSNLSEIYRQKDGYNITLATRKEADFSHPNEVEKYLSNHIKSNDLDLIINACAYTAVDKAEQEIERKICEATNHLSVKIIAQHCAKLNIPLIHYSTDYVYNGEGDQPFSEDDKSTLNPLSIYGKSKLAGDISIEELCAKYIILRTSWVYNHAGKNFAKTILNLASEREELNIVADQIGAPSYAYDLAVATQEIIDKVAELKQFPSGIYHLCPNEKISWHEFAKLIVKEAISQNFPIKISPDNISPIPTSQYPTPAKRPLNSRLNTKKLQNTFNIKLPSIQSSIKQAIRRIK